MRKNENFDVVLAKDCARAFTTSTGLGTVVSLADGEPLATYGTYHCENCRICQLAGKQAYAVHTEPHLRHERSGAIRR